MGTTTETRITSTQAKDAIYKAHSISSTASEIDIAAGNNILYKISDNKDDVLNTNTQIPKRGSGYIFTSGVENLQFLNDNKITEAQISNGLLVAPISTGTVTATYSSIELNELPIKLSCKVVFSSVAGTDSGSVALISNPNGNGYVANILKKSIHIVFDKYKVIIGLYSNSTQLEQITHTYTTPCISDGITENNLSWEIIGNTIKITYPSGSYTYTPTNILSGFNGKYVTFEHFISNTGTPSIPSFSYIEVVAPNTKIVDNFKKSNGDLYKTGTGENWVVMPNGFANKTCTYYSVLDSIDKTATLNASAQLMLPAGTYVQDIRIGRHRWLLDDVPSTYNNTKFISCTQPTSLAYINGSGTRLYYNDKYKSLPLSFNVFGGAIAVGTERMDSQGLSTYLVGSYIPRDNSKPNYLLAWDTNGNQLICPNKGRCKINNISSAENMIKFVVCPEVIEAMGSNLSSYFNITDLANITAKDNYYKWLDSQNLYYKDGYLYIK